jgi:hypothetical protein
MIRLFIMPIPDQALGPDAPMLRSTVVGLLIPVLGHYLYAAMSAVSSRVIFSFRRQRRSRFNLLDLWPASCSAEDRPMSKQSVGPP